MCQWADLQRRAGSRRHQSSRTVASPAWRGPGVAQQEGQSGLALAQGSVRSPMHRQGHSAEAGSKSAAPHQSRPCRQAAKTHGRGRGCRAWWCTQCVLETRQQGSKGLQMRFLRTVCILVLSLFQPSGSIHGGN